MADDDLKVHDVNVTETPVLGQNGKVSTQRRLTFWVGTHGPFTKTYDEGVGNTQQYRLDIAKEVEDLAALHQFIK